MSRVAVVGSGPAGIGATTVLLERGHEVTLFDGGQIHEDPGFIEGVAERLRAGRRPSTSQWRRMLGVTGGAPLAAASQALLGEVDPRAVAKRILGSDFVFRGADHAPPARGDWLPRSLAVGGLANAWGAACYTPRSDDYGWLGLDEQVLRPHLVRAMQLMGVTGSLDGTSLAYPDLGALQVLRQPRDPRSPLGRLVGRWSPDALARHGLAGGRSRLAVDALDGAGSCVRCGLCALGCATASIWSPRHALPGVRVVHRAGVLVERIEEGSGGARILTTAGEDAGTFDHVLLAAGVLGSAVIARRTLGRTRMHARISENDVYLLPMVPIRPGGWHRRRGFGLSEGVLALGPGVVADGPVHVQIYRVGLPLLGPLGKVLGAGPRLGVRALDRAAGAGVLAFVYAHGQDSRDISLELDDRWIAVSAGPPSSEPIARAVAARLTAAAGATGLLPLTPLLRGTGPGTSVHLAASLADEVDGEGRLGGSDRVRVVDASVLPASPAQNLTLMATANAMRIAAEVP